MIAGKHCAAGNTPEMVPRRKAKKAKSSKAAYDVHEASTGELCSPSEVQPFMGTSKAVNKLVIERSDAHMASFKKAVKGGKQELSNFLTEGVQDMLQKYSCMEAVYKSAVVEGRKLPDLTDMKSSGRSVRSKAAWHPAYQTAKSLISSSRRLIRVYEKICQEIASSREMNENRNDWGLDCVKLDFIFEKQRNTTELKLNKNLQEKYNTTKIDHSVDARPPVEDLWISFAGSQREEFADMHDENWAAAVRRVGKGVQWLLKHLPDDE